MHDVRLHHVLYILDWIMQLQYVAEIGQPLHMRVSSHQYDITHRRTDESPVLGHFNSRVHLPSDMAIMVFEQVRSYDPCLRKTKEGLRVSSLRNLSLSFLATHLWEAPCPIQLGYNAIPGWTTKLLRYLTKAATTLKHCAHNCWRYTDVLIVYNRFNIDIVKNIYGCKTWSNCSLSSALQNPSGIYRSWPLRLQLVIDSSHLYIEYICKVEHNYKPI